LLNKNEIVSNIGEIKLSEIKTDKEETKDKQKKPSKKLC